MTTLTPVTPHRVLPQSTSSSRLGLKGYYELAVGQEPLHIFQGGKVLQENGQFISANLVTLGSKILSVGGNLPSVALWLRRKLRPSQFQVHNATGMLLTPGLIDQHNHGAHNVCFSHSSADEITQLAKRMPSYGVTSVLPTLSTAPTAELQASIQKVNQSIAEQAPQGQTRWLGIHLEGPFLEAKQKGAHNSEWFQKPTSEALQQFASPYLKVMTMAVEHDRDLKATQQLTQQGIRVQVGHSMATYDQVAQAQQKGLSGVTHLYNQMSPFHHRQPGVVGSALMLPGLKSELTADGHHVHPDVVKMTIQRRPDDIILQTDSMYLAGMPDGQKGHMCGKPVVLRDGKVVDANCGPVIGNGDLSGSSAFLNQCVQNVVKWGITDFGHAVNMASKHPADYLGFTQLGRLKPGAMADIVLWDEKTLNVRQTFIGGKKAY